MPDTRMKAVLQVLLAGVLIFSTLYLIGRISQRGKAVQANNYWFPFEPDFNQFITFHFYPEAHPQVNNEPGDHFPEFENISISV